MITSQHRKELFSFSYLSAIAAQAGANLNLGDGFFDYGIDAAFKQVINKVDNGKLVSSGVQFEVQAKCTENIRKLVSDEQHFSYDLKADNYNQLTEQSLVPRILVIVGVPKEDERLTIELENERMILKNLAYWVNLIGMEASSRTGTVAVRIPRQNLFTPSTVESFFDSISKEGILDIR